MRTAAQPRPALARRDADQSPRERVIRVAGGRAKPEPPKMESIKKGGWSFGDDRKPVS